MNQSKLSGAEASHWGHATAAKIAAAIGATGIGRASNECVLAGERVVIKCARAATTSVGVTFKMLKQLENIIGAFQLDDGSFDVWSLTPGQFTAATRETRSTGAAAGKVGIVAKSTFERSGRHLGRVRITAG